MQFPTKFPSERAGIFWNGGKEMGTKILMDPAPLASLGFTCYERTK